MWKVETYIVDDNDVETFEEEIFDSKNEAIEYIAGEHEKVLANQNAVHVTFNGEELMYDEFHVSYTTKLVEVE